MAGEEPPKDFWQRSYKSDLGLREIDLIAGRGQTGRGELEGDFCRSLGRRW